VTQVDLHIHSTASDGKLSPAEVVRRAVELGLSVIAITDHDTVDGIATALETAAAFPGLTVIPGVEISTDVPSGEVHILGYYIEYTDPYLKSHLDRFRNSRATRAEKMVAKLNSLGIHVEWARVKEIAGSGAIGRPHVAQAMLEKGYISSLKEAFSSYIGRWGPAYVERDKMTPQEAVALILRAGGLPVMAHPFTVTKPESLIIELAKKGLVGLETYYKDYTGDEVGQLLSLANKYSLIPTGGSDFHGLDDSDETDMGAANVPVESARQLMTLANRHIPEDTAP